MSSKKSQSASILLGFGLAAAFVFGQAFPQKSGGQEASVEKLKPPAELRLREILAAVESGDEQEMKTLAEDFAQPFLNAIPIAEHVALFREWHNRHGGFEIALIKMSDPYMVEAQLEGKKSGERILLALTVKPDPPHAVAGIEVGPAAPPELPRALRESVAARDPAAVVNGDAGNAIDAVLIDAAKSGFSGCVLAARKGEILIKKGYGWANFAKKHPVTSTTAFDVGSITKPFTATAILALEQRGQLSVSDRIGRFFEGVPKDKSDMTIHHLLTHTSSLLEYHDTKGDFEEMTRGEAVRRILGQKLKFKPGQGNDYSNSGYTLLAAIIEKVSGQSYQEFLKKTVFCPAEMTAAGFYRNPSWTDKDVAVGYGDRELGKINSPLAWPNITWALIGNGGLVMSAEDLYSFHRALKEEKILNEAAQQKAYTAHWEVRPSVGEGYGWVVAMSRENKRIVRHGGANDFGFRAVFSRRPDDDDVIIILSNAGQFADLRRLLAEIEKLIF